MSEKWISVGAYIELDDPNNPGHVVAQAIPLEHKSFEIQSRARIIAAAPDMLEALEEVVAAYDGKTMDTIGTMNLVRKAIAKAKGEPDE